MEIHTEYLNWFRNEAMIFFLKQKLKGVFAKNERGYRLTAENKRF